MKSMGGSSYHISTIWVADSIAILHMTAVRVVPV